MFEGTFTLYFLWHFFPKGYTNFISNLSQPTAVEVFQTIQGQTWGHIRSYFFAVGFFGFPLPIKGYNTPPIGWKFATLTPQTSIRKHAEILKGRVVKTIIKRKIDDEMKMIILKKIFKL